LDLSRLSVLVADDNPHARNIVLALLRGAGITDVQLCGSGAEALDFLRSATPDFAIIDYKMEPIDGVQLTQIIRNSPDSASPYLPIIMLTAFADKARVMEARDAGVHEIVVKPVSAAALFSRIRAVILKSRPFIRSAGYFGPDRRRVNDEWYAGPKRRSGDVVPVAPHVI
jgi:two-component system, chemotaxis family, chemotaxis protein CheY